MPSNFSNWTLFGHLKDPVAAVRDQCLLYERSKVPPNFLAELLVAVTLDDQSNIIAIHAAALEIQNVGIVLTGPSRAGKTTTSMHLAERGHALLGDEISAIRLTARELIPFRKSISLRSGPRSSKLALRLSNMPIAANNFEEEKNGPYRIDRLFPDSMVNPIRLGAIFFLTGKANEASCEPFQLKLKDTEIFNYMAANDAVAVSWGLNPVQRSLRLLALYQLIERIHSWKIIIGDPDSTAKLIEKCAIDSLGEKYDANR